MRVATSLSLRLDQTDRKPKPKTKESSYRLPPFRHLEHRVTAVVVVVAVANSQLSSSQQNKVPIPLITVNKVREKKTNLRSQSRSEIGKTWHLLPIEERAKFGQAADGAVAARNISGEQPHCESFVIPNNFDFPPTDEEIPGTTNHLGHKAETINTRCTPSRWSRIVKKLSEEQKQVVHALGFGNLLALDCGRLRLKICRWLVDNLDTKASSIDIHDQSWFFSSLCEGIEKFQKNRPIMQTCCISGCVLFLQISVEEFFKQPTQSNGQYDCAAHGETSQANQVPVTGNHANMKGIADVLQLVKEIQSTMKTELDNI
ncbi:hypothetical protein LWI28_007541 [Acer negundo]|uniref:Uncharacterized protein n=1 Tax=Acer negundo TaxID=4023 RepID=A0AAD5JCR4_ACENE|nr:hypothetical protein LWI28_007541 [Acer negundo]